MKELIKKSIDWFVIGAIIIYVVAIAWVLIDNLDKSSNKCCVVDAQNYQNEMINILSTSDDNDLFNKYTNYESWEIEGLLFSNQMNIKWRVDNK